MSLLQFRFAGVQILGFKFSPSLVGLICTIACMVLFIKLGYWQYDKAEQKRVLQSMYDKYDHEPAIELPQAFDNPEEWRYRKVKLAGEYLTQYQIILDNQIENEVAGYHVITPVKVKNSEKVILVDRGWIPSMADHSQLPKIQTPLGLQEIDGQLWLPSSKIYTLESKDLHAKQEKTWQALWQNMDMKRYAAQVPFQIMPLVVRLDAQSKAGGYLRRWLKPAERIETHLSYAYQWFGFAAAAFIIFIVVNCQKVRTE